MSTGQKIPQAAPSVVDRRGRRLLLALVGVALALALTLVALVVFLRLVQVRSVPPSARSAEPRNGDELIATRDTRLENQPALPAVHRVNPDAPIIATKLYIGADDFVVDIFHNGERVDDSAREMNAEVFGAIGETVSVTVREGDWLVFNVVNNRLRWGGACYFGVAGVRDDGSVGFVSEEGAPWSVCDEPGLVPRFIAEPDFLADHAARRIEEPWTKGDKLIRAHVKDWQGSAIWGSPDRRNIWLKFNARAAQK